MGKGIVLLATDCDTTRIVYHFLKANGLPVKQVIIEQPVSKKLLIKRRIKNLGIVKVVGQLLFMALISPLLKRAAANRRKQIMQEAGISDASIPEKMIVRVESVNEDNCRKTLQDLDPAIILVNGTRIISKKTLAAATAPFINIHTGITPMFRGVHGGYWAIATGHPELFGTTIHQVDAGIDTGNVIDQVVGLPTPQDNFATYPLLQYVIVLPVLKSVLSAYLSGEPIAYKVPMVSVSRLWYHPTALGYLTSKK